MDWFLSDWSSECSTTCGRGLQSRHVTCGGLSSRKKNSAETETNLVENDDLEDEESPNLSCDDSKRPSEERECFTERNCGEPSWFTSDWGKVRIMNLTPFYI